ncbi:rab GTPase-binding effector protein 2 isoform X6 [Loxodonta africana]|uniref:rab GTPase-binding effector protein 2 isoform X6 n=1 Tax=Loxodonta africana TaxID=9785 RepID=UPI0005403DAB|nr:rab GTPase-binding effector protein 2 isoform X5 [Loxodonta africana]
MAAAASAAAGEDGRRRPGVALDHQPQEGAKAEAESGELCRLRAELAAALAEMETMKAVAEVSESTKAEAVAAVRRQCQEEVASLQAILKDSICSYEAQIASLKQERQQQQQECEEKERELGRLKQLLSRAHPLDSLEKQMEKAHEDSEKLREIVLPMEQEIEELKAKLLRAEELIQEIQRRPRHPSSLHGSTELLPLSRDPSPPLEPLEELSGEGGTAAEAFAHNCDDSASISSFSLGGGASSSTSLPHSRQGLSPEQEETASLVSTGTLVPEGIYLPPPGYQLVPDNQWEQLQTEELQQLVRYTRQEARASQQTREHEAERLRIEIVTLREALEEETAARASLEGQLRVQREESEVLEASLCSLRTELERVQQEQSRAGQQEALRPPSALGQTEEAPLTDLFSEQRAKMLRLQAELETSEQVQRDFVRLSQALQVRLERIRQAETLEQVHSILDEAPLRDVRDIKDT